MHMRSILNFPLLLCKYQVDVDKCILLVNTVVNERPSEYSFPLFLHA
jgi:hypothetical protein